MCGRYVARREVDDLLVEFEAEDATGPEPAGADYNVAPTKPVPAVLTRRRSGDRTGPLVRQLRIARWGLVPSWAPNPSTGGRMINARAETAAALPAFRAALGRRRCLLPADGWYEWAPRDGGAGRQPYFIGPADGSVIAFAGLYEFWGQPDQRVTSCAIVTTAAVGELRAVHSRMPLVLPRAAWADWLDPLRADPGDLLGPPPEALVAGLTARPVGPAVGNVANNGPQLLAPSEPERLPGGRAQPPAAPVAQPLF